MTQSGESKNLQLEYETYTRLIALAEAFQRNDTHYIDNEFEIVSADNLDIYKEDIRSDKAAIHDLNSHIAQFSNRSLSIEHSSMQLEPPVQITQQDLQQRKTQFVAAMEHLSHTERESIVEFQRDYVLYVEMLQTISAQKEELQKLGKQLDFYQWRDKAEYAMKQPNLATLIDLLDLHQQYHELFDIGTTDHNPDTTHLAKQLVSAICIGFIEQIHHPDSTQEKLARINQASHNMALDPDLKSALEPTIKEIQKQIQKQQPGHRPAPIADQFKDFVEDAESSHPGKEKPQSPTQPENQKKKKRDIF